MNAMAESAGGAADYLRALNPEQREAVETVDGPLLVLAGAGTGKTRVLTTRFAHILMSGRAFPGQVLAVTFTNRAAREMRERVASILGRPAEGLWLGTFHALCARMLRRHAEHVGLTPSFNILDTDDQLRLLKQVMEAARIDPKRFTPQAMMGLIQRWKDRGLTPARIGRAEDSDFANGRGTEVYATYQERLKTLNTADFGDLLLYMTEILRTQPDVLAQYHRSFRYILVDEYQDTNLVQYLWLRLLAQERKNICCVGDDDQSIYSWRGAEIENILRFEKDFPGARIVRLERNYRSTAPILAAAAGLIANNEGRLGKTLRSGRNDSAGEKVSVVGLWDSDEEARMVAGRMEDLHREKHPLAQMAVLVRAGFQTRAFEERLIAIGLPYRVIGGLRFYERQEIRDAIAYARVLQTPADDLAFERIVNLPRRGVGEQAMRSFHDYARAHSVPLTAAAAALAEAGQLRGKVREGMRDLLRGFDRWREQLARDGHVTTLATMLDESGYMAMWQNDKSPDAPGRLENLKELVRALSDYDTLAAFLDHVSLVMENEETAESDRVSLMTLHAAKGLEFDTVFLPGWEEGLFPSQRTMDESGLKGLEEERRLAYVGLTRARKRAVVSHAANRRVYANWQSSIPSRFIDELPDAEIERSGSAALGRERLLNGPTVFTGQFPLVARRVREAEAWEQTPPRPSPEQAIAVGTRVFHEKFGYGTVTGSEDHKLDIAFEKAGAKRLLDSFVQRA
jgi:DNA helicase-2/ATP-dependent DNA helicase PcrA